MAVAVDSNNKIKLIVSTTLQFVHVDDTDHSKQDQLPHSQPSTREGASTQRASAPPAVMNSPGTAADECMNSLNLAPFAVKLNRPTNAATCEKPSEPQATETHSLSVQEQNGLIKSIFADELTTYVHGFQDYCRRQFRHQWWTSHSSVDEKRNKSLTIEIPFCFPAEINASIPPVKHMVHEAQKIVFIHWYTRQGVFTDTLMCHLQDDLKQWGEEKPDDFLPQELSFKFIDLKQNKATYHNRVDAPSTCNDFWVGVQVQGNIENRPKFTTLIQSGHNFSQPCLLLNYRDTDKHPSDSSFPDFWLPMGIENLKQYQEEADNACLMLSKGVALNSSNVDHEEVRAIADGLEFQLKQLEQLRQKEEANRALHNPAAGANGTISNYHSTQTAFLGSARPSDVSMPNDQPQGDPTKRDFDAPTGIRGSSSSDSLPKLNGDVSLPSGRVSTMHVQPPVSNSYTSIPNGQTSTVNTQASVSNKSTSIPRGFASILNGYPSARNGYLSTKNTYKSTTNGYMSTKNSSMPISKDHTSIPNRHSSIPIDHEARMSSFQYNWVLGGSAFQEPTFQEPALQTPAPAKNRYILPKPWLNAPTQNDYAQGSTPLNPEAAAGSKRKEIGPAEPRTARKKKLTKKWKEDEAAMDKLIRLSDQSIPKRANDATSQNGADSTNNVDGL